ncbi:MAG: type II secretion system protein GspG [Acidobacteriota bacterium]
MLYIAPTETEVSMKKEKGFTLIELLIVVAIIGIIAAIAIPNLLSAIQRSKQKRAMGEVRSIATAAQSYATDAQIYPIGSDTFESILAKATLNSDLTPDYIKALPNPDPWNTPYQYASTSNGTDFGTASAGKDAQMQISSFTDLINNAPIATNCFENDIVWVDDTFVIKPEGKQKKCV